MTNKEAAEYLISDFDDVRDLLKGIAITHPKVTKGLKPGASRVEKLSEDGETKVTIALFHDEVTAFHVSEYDEPSQKWSKTSINLGSIYNPQEIPAQVQYQDSVHEPAIGLPVQSIDDIPEDVCSRLYGGIALFGTVEILNT
jgi:hypothetical protein